VAVVWRWGVLISHPSYLGLVQLCDRLEDSTELFGGLVAIQHIEQVRRRCILVDWVAVLLVTIGGLRHSFLCVRLGEGLECECSVALHLNIAFPYGEFWDVGLSHCFG
jgi:hypothetical protein